MLQCCVMFFFKFFFFQAEDGIRDRTVTGVQTCALPISNVNCGQYGNVANNDNCATIASGGFLEATGSTLRSNGTSGRSEEHTSELQSPYELVCRLLLEKKNDTLVRKPVQHVPHPFRPTF